MVVFLPNVNSAPTGAQELEIKQEATRPLGDAACCASSFVEMLILAQAIKPPFLIRVDKCSKTEGVVWHTVSTDTLSVTAISIRALIKVLGAGCAGILAEALREDPRRSPVEITPFAHHLVQTIREQNEETQQQVLDMLDHLGNQNQSTNSSDS